MAEQERARLAVIVEHSLDAIIGKTLDGVITSWNRAAERLYGYSAEEAVGQPISIIIPPEERAEADHRVALLRQGRVAISVETVRLHKDGRRIPVSLTLSPIRDASGAVVAASTIERDASERQRAEAALRESEERLQLALRFPALVVFFQDRSLRYSWVHNGAAYAAGEILGRTDRDIMHAEDAQHLEKIKRRVLRTGAGAREEVQIRMKPAFAPRFFELVVEPLRDAQGAIEGVRCAAFDVTEQRHIKDALKQARAEAERANDAKSRFLAAASHDLRQPLQAARLFLDILTGKLATAEQLRIAGETLEALQAAENMLNALLDVSILESGGIEPELADLPVQNLLETLGHECRPQAEAKGLALLVVPCSAVIRSDAVLLKRMLRNLLHNAIRYTIRGRILLGCRRLAGRLRIEVWDTGAGIPQEQLEAIFEDLHQVGNPERNRARGLGLGLAVVGRMARLLDHEVSVRSWPNQGSGFAVTVPLVAARSEAAAPRPAPPAPPPAGPRSILVVEDDGIQLVGLQMLLEGWGYRVMAAADGDAALAALAAEEDAPDLVLSDLRLPGRLSGFELIQAVRERMGRAIPGVILTGDTDPRRLREAKSGDLVLLHKPFDPGNLGGVIAGLLAEGRAAPAALRQYV